MSGAVTATPSGPPANRGVEPAVASWPAGQRVSALMLTVPKAGERCRIAEPAAHERTAHPTAAKADATSLGQIILPVGPHPTAGIVFLGALLWSTPVDAADVLALIRDDDMATPSQESVLAAIRQLVDAGSLPGPQLALDELRRARHAEALRRTDLADATTSGAAPMALRQYAAAVLSEALRRRIESAALALSEWLPTRSRKTWYRRRPARSPRVWTAQAAWRNCGVRRNERHVR